MPFFPLLIHSTLHVSSLSLSPCFRCRQNNNMVVMREHNQKVHLHSLHEKKSSTHQQEKKRKAKGGKRERGTNTESQGDEERNREEPKGKKSFHANLHFDFVSWSLSFFTSGIFLSRETFLLMQEWAFFLSLCSLIPMCFCLHESSSYHLSLTRIISSRRISSSTSPPPGLELSFHDDDQRVLFCKRSDRERRKTWPTEREDGLRILICNPHEKEEIMQE